MTAKPSGTEFKILEAARLVFIKNGLHGARMQDIADTAGINKALLHYYFRSKEMLFDKVFEEAFFNYLNTVDEWNSESLSFKEKIFKYVDKYIEFLTEYPLVPLFIIKEASSNPELFREKVMARKSSKGHVKPIDLIRTELPKYTKEMDPDMFWVMIQSMCSYPFVGGPVFKMGLKLNNKEWNLVQTKKLGITVKQFISKWIG